MSTTTQVPVVPPRPTRGQDAIPQIPPRPIRRAIDRSISPSHDRFAPSPLNETLLSKSPYGSFNNGSSFLSGEPLDRTNSVDMPSLGQEGMEYAAAEELSAKSQAGSSRAASPEHTRTVGDDLKLHAPKPSLPAISAKQRVATVTRTDSEKAASYGIGQPGSDSTKKKNSSITSQEQSSAEDLDDEEHGIPEIGVQVPMYPNAGDVQAPTPAAAGPATADVVKKYHHRKRSAQLPPGSYGLHGHGVIPSDKLEQAYFSKHPELINKELTPHHADRAKDFSRTSAELNKIVYETAAHGAGVATHDTNGTPSEQVGWQAIDESISRPTSVAPKGKSSSFGSQSSTSAKKSTATGPEISLSAPPEDDVIHVDEPRSRRKSVMFSDDDADYETEAPILAPDEVAKDPSAYEHPPAVEPEIEHHLGSFDGDASSRPISRPASIRNARQTKASESAISDDKDDEYEPLFKDDDKPPKPRSISARSLNGDETPSRFPSRDVWEDAPKSTYYTAVVSTPELPENPSDDAQVAEGEPAGRPSLSEARSRSDETPAQAFARHQEELAEQELRGTDAFLENRRPQKPKPWAMHQSYLTQEIEAAAAASAATSSSASPAGSKSSTHRPAMSQRFPSRDVWEDAPESLQLQTVVSHPQVEEVPSPADAAQPEIPERPVRKLTDPSSENAEKAIPIVPSRPKPKAADEGAISKPIVPERPKPQVPARPAVRQQEPESVSAAAPRPKPAVPARPFGGKIAQLQATFMSDLNKKLKIGPQAPKKEEPAESSEGAAAAAEAEKVPLVDARKGRARGPQRRAPVAAAAAAPAAAAAAAAAAPLALGFSSPVTLYSIDPEEGVLSVSGASEAVAVEAPAETKVEADAEVKEPEEESGEKEVDAVEAKVEEEKETGEEEAVEVKAEKSEPDVVQGDDAGELTVKDEPAATD